MSFGKTESTNTSNAAPQLKDFSVTSPRLEGGTCIIELSDDRSENIIIPVDILQHFPYFSPTIEGRWNDSCQRKVRDEETGKELITYTWGLDLDTSENKVLAYKALTFNKVSTGYYALSSGVSRLKMSRSGATY
jgi:hypothetical protein